MIWDEAANAGLLVHGFLYEKIKVPTHCGTGGSRSTSLPVLVGSQHSMPCWLTQ